MVELRHSYINTVLVDVAVSCEAVIWIFVKNFPLSKVDNASSC